MRTIRGWLKAPDLGRSDLNRRANLLYSILTVVLFSTLLLSIVLYAGGPGSRFAFWLSLAATLMSIVGMFLTRRGLLRLAGSATVFFLWFILTVAVYSFDGIEGTAVLGQILVVFLGGLLINEQLGTLLGIMTIASNYGAMMVQTNGGLPYEPAVDSLANRWVVQAVYLLISVGLMQASVRSIRAAFSESRWNEQVLKDRVAELRQAQTSLEMSGQDLLRREAILKAVGVAAEKLFKGSSLSESVPPMIADLGKAAGADRVYIFENHTNDEGHLLSTQRYEWSAKGVSPQIDNTQLQDFDFRGAGFGRWQELLGRNVVVRGVVSDFPASERSLLEEQDISSILVVPIFAGDDWWGFMGFDETKWRREWSPAEEDALRAAAGILGGAIERRRTEEALNRSEARYRAILRDQVELISRYLPDGSITFTNEAFRRYFEMTDEQAKKANIWEMVSPTDESRLRQKVAALTPKTPVLVSKSKSPRGDGELRWMEWTDRGIFDSEDNLVEIQAVGRDIHEEERLRQEIETQAMTDGLTGLLNRRAIMDHAEAEWHRAEREGRPFSLILLDVDRLKEINDTHGHLVGDQALVTVAKLLRSGMRRYDWVGRWGGDEFLVVLPNTGEKEAVQVAERTRLAIKSARVETEDGQSIELFSSMGVACQDSVKGDGKQLESLVARADEALYSAKQGGRDRVGTA